MTKILIADDEFDISSTMQAILELEGFEVMVCSNGQEVLDCLAKHRPDLLILDIMMPILSGLGALRRIQADPKLESIPVILMSAVYPSTRDREGVRSEAFLRKPFSVELLLSTIREVTSSGRPRPPAQKQPSP